MATLRTMTSSIKKQRGGRFWVPTSMERESQGIHNHCALPYSLQGPFKTVRLTFQAHKRSTWLFGIRDSTHKIIITIMCLALPVWVPCKVRPVYVRWVVCWTPRQDDPGVTRSGPLVDRSVAGLHLLGRCGFSGFSCKVQLELGLKDDLVLLHVYLP